MLINQNNIAILKKDALQKLRIIFCITMAIVFCFALQVGADEKTDIGAAIKAAEQGFAMAQRNLGFMYDNGQGVPQDYKKAVYWLYRVWAPS
ncbi:MAG: sel1 repeat family protein [Deltaproteobacteria bacterium]|nr:sel1 repeat family protein [Deltaproteobacteria bacterium]